MENNANNHVYKQRMVQLFESSALSLLRMERTQGKTERYCIEPWLLRMRGPIPKL